LESVSLSAFIIFALCKTNRTVVMVQGLRAHLFEADDASHHANPTEIVMHLEMANKEIAQFLQNLTSGHYPTFKIRMYLLQFKIYKCN
jgi:hypothetical protein